MKFSRQFFITILVLISAALLSGYLSHSEIVPLRNTFHDFPLNIDQWKGRAEKMDDGVVRKLGVEDYMMRLYSKENEGRHIWIYVGYYESQRQGDTIHSPKNCYPGSGWYTLSTGTQELNLEGKPVRVNKILIGKGSQRQLVLYWYHSRGRIIANEYWGKIYLVWDSITKKRTDGALVRISTVVKGSLEETLKEELDFIYAIVPKLDKFLPI